MSSANAWMRDASCGGTDPDSWVQDAPHPQALKLLRRICNDCPVQTACLQYAIDERLYGIWGGTTMSQRERMRRNARREVSA